MTEPIPNLCADCGLDATIEGPTDWLCTACAVDHECPCGLFLANGQDGFCSKCRHENVITIRREKIGHKRYAFHVAIGARDMGHFRATKSGPRTYTISLGDRGWMGYAPTLTAVEESVRRQTQRVIDNGAYAYTIKAGQL